MTLRLGSDALGAHGALGVQLIQRFTTRTLDGETDEFSLCQLARASLTSNLFHANEPLFCKSLANSVRLKPPVHRWRALPVLQARSAWLGFRPVLAHRVGSPVFFTLAVSLPSPPCAIEAF